LGSKRRGRVLSVAVVLGLAAAVALEWHGRAGRRADGPIVLISIDTLRADHLALYGYAQGETPAIDALARDAVVFDHAYSHSPQTLPAHTSILSGRLPFEHGVRDNVGFVVKPGEKLLPELLRSRGFASAGVVSAYVLRKETGIAQGFDFFDGDVAPASAGASLGQIQRSGEQSLAAARRWLDTRRDRRFFLFFHVYEPHRPYAPPDRFRHLAPYDGEIATADEAVGGLLRSLRERGLYDPALIVLLADHGEGLGDHGEQEHGLFLYDETIRVPLLVKLPGHPGGGRRVAAVVQHIDLVPTILDLAGAAIPAGLRGRSLRPLLESAAGAIPEPAVYSEALYARFHFGWSELYAITDTRYRYIRAPREELYDLQADPGERRDLAASRPQTRAAMRSALEARIAGRKLEAPGQVSDEDRAKLAALGYVGAAPAVPIEAAGDGLADPKDKVPLLEVYRQASALAGERRFSEAIPLYRKILAEDPGMSDVWLQLAQVCERSGQDKAAAEAFRRALLLSPGDSGAILALGNLLLRLGRPAEAEAEAGLALSAAPAAAHELRARVALARDDAAAAEKEAALAHEADPTLPLPLYVRGLLLYRAGRYAEALPPFQEALARLQARTVQIGGLHYYTGDTLARLERYPEAESELAREIELFPENLSARASLAMVYVATGREAQARDAVDGILRSAPTPEGFSLAAELWTIFQDRDRARAVTAEGERRFGPGWRRSAGR
jgi:arylsulfatase A-like enzyme/Flp pilus assembly protein TadD